MSEVGARILVVDDNALNRALARDTLEDEGYVVEVVGSGHLAVAAFERTAPDCVLLDVQMPELDGFEVCQRIRRLPAGANVPIIFITAQRDLETFDRATHVGGDYFIAKPYRPSELVMRVESALALRKLADARSELYAHMKRQRDELQRMQLQKEQFIAFLVHDLKNPVNSIELNAQAGQRDPSASPALARKLLRIREDARSLLRMITNLLDLGKSDEAKLVPSTTRFAVAGLVDEVVTTLRSRADAAGVQLSVEVSALEIEADPGLVRRILENLLDNAIRYAPPDSTVSLVARPARGGIEFRVSDAGAGVPPHLRERVFDRYARLEPDAERSNHGLGLAFCKVAVEAQGGKIWVEDAQPGAAFHVWLAS